MKIKGKKGLADDFGSLLIAGLLMVVMAIIILVYSGIQEKTYLNRPTMVSNLEESSYTTRAILDWELENGLKVHEALIKYNNENNLDQFAKELEKELTKQNLLPSKQWLIVIKTRNTPEPIVKDTSEDGTFKETSTRRKDQNKRNSYLAMTRVTIPDGRNNIIEVVIKQIKETDWELYQKLQEIEE
jgi:hypothetical protein